MKNIEEIAINNYNENMIYFEKNHESIYSKLKALEVVISDGRFPQKYDLEYKNGYFDVIELSSGNFFYSSDSNQYSKKLANQLSFKKNEQVFETFFNYDFTPEAIEKSKTNDALCMYANSAEIIQYYNENTKKTDSLKYINKIMFIGLGLGLHLGEILDKTGADTILIIEDNIELFRLSLFVSNYKELLDNKSAFFSIAQTKSEFQNTFYSFYLDSFVRNHFIKFSLFSDAYDAKIKLIQELIISRSEKVYPHEFLLYKNSQVLKRLDEGCNFLNLQLNPSLQTFAHKPILIIGAGPSLSKSSQWLSEHADEFTIFAALASLSTLKKLSIKPDFVLQIDEKVLATEGLLDKLGDLSFLDDSIFVFTASVADVLFEHLPKERIFLIEDRTQYISRNQPLISASVGEFSYAVALYLNPKEIYLLGLDLALNDDGSTHAKDHHLSDKIDTSNSDKIDQNISLNKSTLYVKGNFKERVSTTPLLAMSIPKINYFTSTLKQKTQEVFNLSDGAYFEQTTPLLTKDYSPKKPNNALNKEKALHYLNSISQNKLTQADKKLLFDKKLILSTYKLAIQEFQESATSDDITFTRAYTKMLNAIFNSQESELREILVVYILNTSTFIVDFFNTKELENQKKHIKKMKKMVHKNIKEILDMYESMVKDF